MNDSTNNPVLQAGGTLTPGQHLYITRPEDAELLGLLSDCEYCNILTPRQMGKSSLVNQVARALDERNFRVVQIDLQSLGTPPSLDDWYLGLLTQTARDLDLRTDVRRWWTSNAWPTPNQRLIAFFEEVVTESIPDPIVVFVDEIDWTLKVDYTDDFFAAIRAMYNQRGKTAAFRRVAFCLVGVASPNELIKNKLTTPYNVGRPVELRDFDPARDDLTNLYRVLSPGDPRHGEAVVAAVLAWTGGHPYLTMSFCRRFMNASHAAGGDPNAAATGDLKAGDARAGDLKAGDLKAGDLKAAVERFVEREFKRYEAVPEDDKVHFQRVTEYLSQRAQDKYGTLQLYRRIRRGHRESDRSTQIHIDLKLSGIVKRDNTGALIVRNRLYERIFTDAWAVATIPRVERQVRLARVVAAWAAALVLLVAVGAGWQAYRGDQRQTELAVNAAINATPESFPQSLTEVLARRGSALPMLKKRLADEAATAGGLSAMQRLHGLCALAALGDMRAETLSQLVADEPTLPGTECGIVVAAMENARGPSLSALKAAHQRLAADRVKSRSRLAILAWHLGDSELVDGMCALGPDPTDRTGLISELSEWHGDVGALAKRVEAAQLSQSLPSATISAFCLGVGSIAAERRGKDRSLGDCQRLVGTWFVSHPDSGVHSAAGWALRQWGLPEPRLPESPLAEQRANDPQMNWQVTPLGLTFIRVPKGEFERRFERRDEDDPNAVVQRVLFPNDFWVCDREVTVALFRQFINDKEYAAAKGAEFLPVNRTGVESESDNDRATHPVVDVDWFDAVKFCNWLSWREGRSPCYQRVVSSKPAEKLDGEAWKLIPASSAGYRLLTEAEWEYTCRAGTNTDFASGNDAKTLERYAVFGRTWTGRPSTEAVGSKMCNGWGLFDMHGNVWEWCHDRYGPYGSGDASAPSGPPEGSNRVVRGGSWNGDAAVCRAADRNWFDPTARSSDLGFRLALSFVGVQDSSGQAK